MSNTITTEPTVPEIEIQKGETVCLEIAGKWGVCGPRFFSTHGTMIRTIEHFASGTVRYCDREKSAVRLLRGTTLLRIA